MLRPSEQNVPLGSIMINLDVNFILRAEQRTSFNFVPQDFTNLNYKREIQFLFNKHFFPLFELSETLNGLDLERLNKLIRRLKALHPDMFNHLHNYNLKGIGPGELTLYLLLNNGYLGGGTTGTDLFHLAEGFEVKAVDVSPLGTVNNFKLGSNVPMSDIMQDIANLGLTDTPTEIKKSLLDFVRSDPAFVAINSRYAEAAYYHYFSKHPVIFIRNSTSLVGEIIAIKEVKPSDISIERVSNGTVKPVVRL